MALPVTISGADVGSQNSYHGPFESSGGNIYTLLRGDGSPISANSVPAFKATDPESSFSEVDSTNRPILGSTILSHNTFQASDDLHMAGQNFGDDVFYTRFDMSSDAWQDVDGGGNTEVLVDGAPNGTTDACDIAVLSAAYGVGSAFVKIRVVYQGETDMDMGGAYERIDESNSVDDGENWSGPTSIDAAADGAGVHYNGPRIVLPPSNSDQCHMVYKSGNNGRLRSIAGDDTIRDVHVILPGVGSTADYPYTHGIGFDRSGTSKVRFGIRRTLNFDFEVYEFNAFSDNRNPSKTNTTISTDDVQVDNGSINACLAADGSVIRGLLVKSTNDDLFEFFDDDADSYTLEDQIFSRALTSSSTTNIGASSGTEKLAFSFDATSTGEVRHGEVRLSKTGSPTDNLTITIETDSGGEPSGTPVVTFETIAGGDLTTSPVNYSIAASTAGTLTNGVTYWIVYSRSGSVNGSNYFKTVYSSDSDAGTGRKYWNGSVWGSLSTTFDGEHVLANIVAGTVNHISCNVYDRSGTKLAMIYDDGGTVKYDEISFAVGLGPPEIITMLNRDKISPIRQM